MQIVGLAVLGVVVFLADIFLSRRNGAETE